MIPASVAVQSVHFLTPISVLEKVLHTYERVAVQLSTQLDVRLLVFWGDCSPRPICPPDVLEDWRARFAPAFELRYEFFGENLGHGAGQNRLANSQEAEYTMFANPDLLPLPDAVSTMLEVLQNDPQVGVIDGKQVPFEHPKAFDPVTGDTSWCSGAFSMVRSNEFAALGGFDHDTFYMHGDDVDLSWRYRLAGFRTAHQPGAVAFHDKRFDASGTIAPSPLEKRYSALAALMLAHKYSNPSLVDDLLRVMEADDATPEHHEAAASYRRQQDAGHLPQPIDESHRVARFTEGNYGRHRW